MGTCIRELKNIGQEGSEGFRKNFEGDRQPSRPDRKFTIFHMRVLMNSTLLDWRLHQPTTLVLMLWYCRKFALGPSDSCFDAAFPFQWRYINREMSIGSHLFRYIKWDASVGEYVLGYINWNLSLWDENLWKINCNRRCNLPPEGWQFILPCEPMETVEKSMKHDFNY